MNHLLGWRIFESGETYSPVPLHSLYAGFFFDGVEDSKDNIKDFKISDLTIKKILTEFPSLRIGESNPLFTHRSSCTTFWDIRGNFDLDIYEVSDEWFYVEAHVKTGTHAYKCDQLDGLFDCISDVYSSFG